MSFEERCHRELELAGLFGPDADYDGMTGKCVMDLVKLFGSQGHSGMSAMLVSELFSRLVDGEALTPLTNNPDEWMDRSDVSGVPLWQNNRNSKAFSSNGGTTYWVLDAVSDVIESKNVRSFVAGESEIEVTFDA